MRQNLLSRKHPGKESGRAIKIELRDSLDLMTMPKGTKKGQMKTSKFPSETLQKVRKHPRPSKAEGKLCRTRTT